MDLPQVLSATLNRKQIEVGGQVSSAVKTHYWLRSKLIYLAYFARSSSRTYGKSTVLWINLFDVKNSDHKSINLELNNAKFMNFLRYHKSDVKSNLRPALNTDSILS